MQDKIIEALRRNAVEEALTQAREWAASQPADAQAHRWLAQALQQSGEHAAAMESLDRAIDLAPEDASLQMALASLLIGGRQLEGARSALTKASELNPNQFDAYIMGAQLALGRGDLDEAERLNRMAGRVAPGHPQLAVVDSMVALRRGDAPRALQLVSAALQQAPDDSQLLYAAGFIYMGNQHWAFAEQIFRRVVENVPGNKKLHGLISDLVARQGRPAEAADQLIPLLDDPQTATAALWRHAGLLRLSAGQAEQALPLLRNALAGKPDDERTLQALVQVWRQLGLEDNGRDMLEAALATSSGAAALWMARVTLEQDPDVLPTLAARWVAAMPQSVLPLEFMLSLQQRVGDAVEADASAARLLALEPSHRGARLHLLNAMAAQDPASALGQVEEWLRSEDDPANRCFLLGLSGLGHDRAGDTNAAIAAWTDMQQVLAQVRVPLPPIGSSPAHWPAFAERAGTASRVTFLWGPPGSGVERIAAVLEATNEFRADRFGPNAPQDGFQTYAAIEGLSDGSITGEQVVAHWRAALPARGAADLDIFDWLPWWDNVLLLALRPHLPESRLLIVVRDPRDMLLEWMAFGTATPFAMPSAQAAAEYLANALDQVASLVEFEWFPARVIRTDAVGNDPQAAAAAVNGALQVGIPAPASVGPAYFSPGHWRQYTQALAEPFAVLSPVAMRLGYPAD